MSSKYQAVYSPLAKDDLVGIYRYIAYELLEPKIAEKQVNRIRNQIKKLDMFPKKHQETPWEPWLSMGMRYFPIDNFVVYYLVNDDHNLVTIARIFYGGRNIENIIQDR